ncbi:MAG: hypothetical protein ACI4S2_12515 [Lachnospiraceae bacterium]
MKKVRIRKYSPAWWIARVGAGIYSMACLYIIICFAASFEAV